MTNIETSWTEQGHTRVPNKSFHFDPSRFQSSNFSESRLNVKFPSPRLCRIGPKELSGVGGWWVGATLWSNQQDCKISSRA